MTNLLRVLRARTTRILVTLVVGALALSGCSIYDVPLPGGPDTGSNPMKITLMFRDVLDLVPQSTVKVNDVTVGKVTKIELKGYVAEVTIALPRSTDLPENTVATIRQTSLLGEKFVSLAPPSDPSSTRLHNGDVIGLDRTGRNPEVEEVFSALALLLNGGGVGQLKTIVSELNNALGGREGEVRSVLDQIRMFTGQLDTNKAAIITAIENTNRLAAGLRAQDGTIKATLDNVPQALASINRQRADLVKLLQSLTRLSGIGVQVIQASKTSTINSLRDLAPVLDKFAEAGQNFPKSFQVFLTYPFVDAAVGQDPQVARNLHIGDYTNLSVNLDLNLGNVCNAVKSAVTLAAQQLLKNVPPAAQNAVSSQLTTILNGLNCDQLSNLTQADLGKLINGLLNGGLGAICSTLNLPNCPSIPPILPGTPPIKLPVVGSGGGLGGVIGGLTGSSGSTSSSGSGSSGSGSSGGGLLGGGGGLLPRAQLGTGYQAAGQIDPFQLASKGYDPGVGTLLFEGVATQR